MSSRPKGIERVTNTVVSAAINALNRRDRDGWFGLFVPEAEFSDDGITRDLVEWCDEEFFGRYRARIISIDRVEDGSLTFYATYHSDKYGDFQTFWKFVLSDDKIAKLDVGATSY